MVDHLGRLLVIVFLIVGTSACSLYVRSEVATFHTLPLQANGKTVAILLAIEPSRQGIESRTYQEKLAQRFTTAGYKVVSGSEKTPPDYVAFFAYGIDNGTLVTSHHTDSTYGVTGYTGPNNMPTYGVTGVTSSSSTDRVFRRVVHLKMYDSTRMETGKPETLPGAMVYEGKVQSDGSCGTFVAVMDSFLDAVFDEFPGESGKVRTVMDPQIGLSC